MKLTEIKKIEEILLLDKPLLKHRILNSASPTKNGSSSVWTVDLRLKNEKNFEEKLEVIAKLGLVANTNGKDYTNGNAIGKTHQSFQNEVTFYKSIVPILKEFLKLQGAAEINLFPLYYGGRLTLNPRTKDIDQDAVFFLENLKKSGFETLESHVGFNLETTKKILQQLSRFHASFLAIKVKKPEVFKHEIKPYVNRSDVSADAEEIKRLVSLMWGHKDCVSLIPRIRKAMAQKKLPPREPLSTIIHNNLWTKNIMVKREWHEDYSIRIVDFQHYDYGSPAADVIFFLFTSAEISVLEDNLDELFNHYHTNFTTELQNFEIEDPSYSLENFLKELTVEASTAQFSRIMMKLKTIFSEDHVKQHEERAWYTVLEFAKRKWI